MSEEEIKRCRNPIGFFHLQAKVEIESHERLKRGEFDELENPRGLDNLLVVPCIAQVASQCELAKRLGVHEPQVS